MNENKPSKIDAVIIQWQVLTAPEEFMPRNKTITVNKPNNRSTQPISELLIKMEDLAYTKFRKIRFRYSIAIGWP